ncbi:hypothetical protein GQ53DRAFT_826124 [Thozetella sp. PMI_491]|nr:hypothetical protein GQ53DRAFT_826124 [Thozetella sp. PMI_491]
MSTTLPPAPKSQDAFADALAKAALAPPASSADLHAFASFVDEFFFLLFIQADDEIFDTAFDRLVSRSDEEDVDDNGGAKLTFGGFKRLIANLRKALGSRRLISSKVLLSPTLSTAHTPATSTAGHTAVFQGVDERGTFVTVNVVAVGTVVNLNDGKAQLALEKIVITRNPLI